MSGYPMDSLRLTSLTPKKGREIRGAGMLRMWRRTSTASMNPHERYEDSF